MPGGVDKAGKCLIGYGGGADSERRYPHLVHGRFAVPVIAFAERIAHREGAGGNLDVGFRR